LAESAVQIKSLRSAAGWAPPWRSQALGAIAGVFVPERQQLIAAADGEVFSATAAPALLHWFAAQPEQAAQVRLWAVYPRTHREEGLAFLVIGSADRSAVDGEFVVQGSVSNQTTPVSKKGRAVFIRVGRNIPRPAGRAGRHPNWKTRVLRLAGRLGSAAGPGDVVRLSVKRVGRELRIVNVHAKVAAEPDPIVWSHPEFSWPWPFSGTAAEIERWARTWTIKTTGPSKDAVLNESRTITREQLPQLEKETLQRLDEFADVQRRLVSKVAAEHQLPASLQQRLELNASRVGWVVARIKRLVARMEIGGRETLFSRTAYLLILQEQVDRFYKEGFTITWADGAPSVHWLVADQSLPVGGKLKRLVLERNGVKTEPDRATARSSSCDNEEDSPVLPAGGQEEFALPSITLAILADIEKGVPDDGLLRTYRLLPGALAEHCRLLAESGRAMHIDPKPRSCPSATMRRHIRYRLREEAGLSKSGQPLKRKPAI
jgi:hypothetical protein